MEKKMNYTYIVTRVDQDAKCMDVEFTAKGFDPITVGVRLPTVGEDVDSVIQSFAPHSVWEPEVVEYAAVPVGKSGSYTAPSLEQVQQQRENMQMWAQVEFEQRIAKALVKFGVLQSDPTSIEVTHL